MNISFKPLADVLYTTSPIHFPDFYEIRTWELFFNRAKHFKRFSNSLAARISFYIDD